MVERLRIVIDSASGLAAADLNGKSDPYVKFRWRGQKYKTEVIRGTLEPSWKETFLLDYQPGKDEKILRLEIWDWDRFGTNDPLGKVELNLSKLDGGRSDRWYPIQPLAGEGHGKIRVKLELISSKVSSTVPPPSSRSRCSPPDSQSPPFRGAQPQYPVQSYTNPPNQPYPNQPYPNQPYPNQPYANQAFPNQPYRNQPYPNSNQPNQPYANQAFPNQPYRNQPYPNSNQPNQPYANQPYPNQPYANQPYPSHQPYQHMSSGGPQHMSSGGGLPGYPALGPAPPMEDPAVELQEILPHESMDSIRAALNRFDGNKEKALNYLLNEQIASVTQLSHQPPPTPAHPFWGQYGPDNLGPQNYSSPYAGMVNQMAPPAAWTHAPLGLQPAMNVGLDETKIYAGEGRKKALLIGINYFNTKAELRGCIQDVHRMKSVLVGIYGFPDIPEAIVMLTDDNSDWKFKPTKQNIIYAMKWLVQDARPGDVFFFHFSGHGAQKRNHNNTEEDGMDETILPCDFKTNGMIVDDDIHALLVQPLPNGSRLTSVMDCCHSGTGMDLPFIWDSNKSDWEEEYCPFYTQGDVQLFSGCSDAQVSADVKYGRTGEAGGAMTTAFISAVTANRWGHSYPSLLQHIRKGLKARGFKNQRPQLSSSQKFAIHRPFNLTDIVPNHNQMLGRQFKRNRRRKNSADGAGGLVGGFGGGGFNPIVGLLGGLAGGLLLGELFD